MDYKKVEVNKIKDFPCYALKKLNEGCVLIRLYMCDDGEIEDLTSYAIDYDGKSLYKDLVKNVERLKYVLIVESMTPIFENGKWTVDNDYQTTDSFETLIGGSEKGKEKEDTVISNDTLFGFHIEYYLSDGKVDISKFGGQLELDFLEEYFKK